MKMNKGDKVYWHSEQVTILSGPDRQGFYLCRREAQSGVMATSGEPFHYPAQDQKIHGQALTIGPNNALSEIVTDYLTRRGKPSKSIH